MEDKTSKMSQLEPNWSPERRVYACGGTMLLAPGVFNFRKDLDGGSTQQSPAGAPDLRRPWGESPAPPLLCRHKCTFWHRPDLVQNLENPLPNKFKILLTILQFPPQDSVKMVFM